MDPLSQNSLVSSFSSHLCRSEKEINENFTKTVNDENNNVRNTSNFSTNCNEKNELSEKKLGNSTPVGSLCQSLNSLHMSTPIDKNGKSNSAAEKDIHLTNEEIQ